MTHETDSAPLAPPLPSGPAPQIGANVEILSSQGRVGDSFVYLARSNYRSGRIREYAPAGVVRRDERGLLEGRTPALARAWRDGARRFIERQRAVANLAHPRIGRIDVLEDPPAAGTASPRADVRGAYTIGPSVRTLQSWMVSAGSKITADFVMATARNLADALERVHRAGLTHLDICPQTISLTPDGIALIDFAVDNRPYMKLLGTQEGLVRPGYAPVELHDGSVRMPLDARTDIYCAAAVLYRLVVGHTVPSWDKRRKGGTLPALAVVSGYPRSLLRAIRWGLEIEPRSRPSSAAKWRAAMFETESGAIVEPPVTKTEPARTPGMSGGAKAALSVLAFLLLAALAWLGFGRPGTNVRQDNSTTTIAVPDAANEAVDVVPPAPEATDSGNDLETNDLQAVEVAETRPTERLGGNWRRPDDASCSSPLNISIAGDQLTYVREGVTFVERIDQDEGSTVTATVQRINGSPTPPRQFTFRVADNGVQLYIASEVWLRCRISVMRLE